MKNPYKLSLLATALTFAHLSMAEAGGGAAAVLDAVLDDLPDLPGFKVPPTGAYAVLVDSITEKKIGDHPAVEAKFKIVEVLEVTETGVEDADAPLPGDEFSIAFMLDNETGVGFLGAFLKPIKEGLKMDKTTTTRQAMEGAKNAGLQLVIRRTYNKEKDQHYAGIKKVAVI